MIFIHLVVFIDDSVSNDHFELIGFVVVFEDRVHGQRIVEV